MEKTHIIKNRDGHYWGRAKEWVDGSERSRVAQYTHRDEASNTLFEISSKDFGLRAEILEVHLKNGKLPKLESVRFPYLVSKRPMMKVRNWQLKTQSNVTTYI